MTMTAADIIAEHKKCERPKTAGCYQHWPAWDHCRACGMKWPCDVELIASRPIPSHPSPGESGGFDALVAALRAEFDQGHFMPWPEIIARIALAPDSLDAAWAEAEAALPEGWEIARTARIRMAGLETMQRWEAMAAPIKPKGRDWRAQYIVQYDDGLTPAAALRALAERLRRA